jgi:CRISPR-associated protein Cmr6
MQIPENKYFNKDFNRIKKYFLHNENNQKQTNFKYIYNIPSIFEVERELKIRINEDLEKFKWSKNFIQTIELRIENTIKKFKTNYFSKIQKKLSWRMVIGLGGSHPQETSMILHHIYGIPYIPASAVKGVTRHWAVQKFAEILFKNKNEKFDKCLEKVSKSLEEGKDKDLDNLKIKIENKEINFNELIRIFGTQKEKGKVIFFDAFPSEDIKLKIDIMNPHYPDYYSGKEPPTDWQNPNPIKFLTVEKTKFTFYLCIKQSEEKELLEKAKILLEDSLKNYGIGAKTALGYGLFE